METEKPDGFPGLPEEFVRQNAKYMRLLQGFRLLDDDFMSKVFEDKECAQLLLHIILERSDLVVQEVHGQYSIKNLQGRSVRLDILAVDQEGKHYNIEIQRQDEGADASQVSSRRATFPMPRLWRLPTANPTKCNAYATSIRRLRLIATARAQTSSTKRMLTP